MKLLVLAEVLDCISLQYCHGSWSSEGVLRKSRQIICFPIDVEEALSNPFVFLIIQGGPSQDNLVALASFTETAGAHTMITINNRQYKICRGHTFSCSKTYIFFQLQIHFSSCQYRKEKEAIQREQTLLRNILQAFLLKEKTVASDTVIR